MCIFLYEKYLSRYFEFNTYFYSPPFLYLIREGEFCNLCPTKKKKNKNPVFPSWLFELLLTGCFLQVESSEAVEKCSSF